MIPHKNLFPLLTGTGVAIEETNRPATFTTNWKIENQDKIYNLKPECSKCETHKAM